MRRREFLLRGAPALVVLAGAPALLLRSRTRHDLVIRGGTVLDGTGRAGIDADVAVSGGRITNVAPHIAGTGATEIDARGRAVAPGFIDIHSHGDGTLWLDPRAESLVRQGVTTIVVGQDGSSRAPRGGHGDDDPAHQFTSLRDLWSSLREQHPAVNVASMIGLGTIRGVVIGGDDRPATPDELQRMQDLVRGALADGACGASSGLEYTPGAFASREELAFLCRPLAARGLPYATHMRNEDDRVLEAVDEAIAVASAARCPLEISHLKTEGPRNWGKLDAIFARIAEARHHGHDVTFDRYPYTAYQTGLTNIFPVWSRDGSTEAFLARVHAPETAARIREETLAKVALIGGWDDIMITDVADAADRDVEGARLGAWAREHDRNPYEAAVALLERSRGDVGMVGFAMSERNLERILAHPLAMVCSDGGAFAIDGPARQGHPHPRGLGTFARVLGRYVREGRTLSLADAVHKMTGRPASRLHLADRGRVAPGIAADIVVFDPESVIDRATYTAPFQYPDGIDAVVVNGAIALRDGQRVGTGAGVPVVPGEAGGGTQGE